MPDRSVSSSPNPFAPTAEVLQQPAIFGDAQLAREAFLFRVIDLKTPIACRLTYSGWWFVQRISVDGRRVWWKVSWLNLERVIRFSVPHRIESAIGAETGAGEADQNLIDGRIEIDFGRGLRIRRFRVWFDDELTFDQIA